MCVFIPWIIYILGLWSPVKCRWWWLYNVSLNCSNYGGWLLFKYIRLVTSGIPIKGVPNILVCSLHSSLFNRIGIHVPVVKYESYYVPQTKFGRHTYMPTLKRLKAVGGGFGGFSPSRKCFFFQKDAKWCILLHFGYKICVVKTLNIVW